jgi:hypothetical protein
MSRHESPVLENRKETKTLSRHKMKASEVRKLPKTEREKYMLEHTRQAAKEYAERPELLIDGGSELTKY